MSLRNGLNGPQPNIASISFATFSCNDGARREFGIKAGQSSPDIAFVYLRGEI